MKQGIFMRALVSDSTEATIDIIGVVGWEANYEKLRTMLRAIPESIKRVVFDIYSPGGDVWEGNGIVQEIGELGKHVETVARVQVAASMATLIAVACQKRSIAANGRFLIHNAWAGVQGDAAEMEKMAQTLRDCEQEAAKFYAQQTGGKAEDMLALMAEERWMMPDETMKLGFVQEISDPFKVEEYEDVKQEIVAAGKWPKALADMPPEPLKGGADGSTTTQGTQLDAATEPSKPVVPANAGAAKTYEQGKAEAELEMSKKLALLQDAGTSAELEVAQLKVRIEEVQAEGETALAERDTLIRQYQSEKDRAISEAKANAESLNRTIEELRTALGDANARLAKLLGGSLAFSPAPYETWEEALASEGGDYEKAAKRDPDRKLRNAYNQKHKQGKR